MPSRIVRACVVLSLAKVRPQVVRDEWPDASCEGTIATIANVAYLPAPKFWRDGKGIIMCHGDYYKIGDLTLRTDKDGTYQTMSGWRRNEKRVGTSQPVESAIRYHVVSAIRSVEDVEVAMADATQ